MKKLLNALYVTQDNMYLSLDGENVVILRNGKEVGRIPLHNLETIVTFSYIGASPALMFKCAENQISLVFLNPNGKFLARTVGKENGNVLLRRQQFRIADDSEASLEIAGKFIIAKLYNSKWILERMTRDYPMRLDAALFKKKSTELDIRMQELLSAKNNDDLRGIEGSAAAAYFSVFDDMILQQKDSFHFAGRSKRPPLDSVNAMLSFAYSLLASMCASALECVGLDPYVGFLHTDRPGRASLALDLMEEFRAVLADRFVLTLINKKIVSQKDFLEKESGAVIMTDDARKAFLTAWQARKKETIVHPFINEKIEWGLVPFVQATLLARYIRGDMDAYPPFLWK